MAPPRSIGFAQPFTLEQVASWVALPVAAVIWYLIVSAFTEGAARTALLTVYTVMLVVVIATWLHCSLVDPKVDTGPYWPCMKEAQKESRYCPMCRKMVPGLDHHCAWLNTCIGRRQYPSFFALVMTLTAMFYLEFVIFILLLVPWRDPARAVQVLGSESLYTALLSLAAFYAFVLAISLSILAVFHIFLQFMGMGTYAYMLEGRQRLAEKRQQKRVERARKKEERRQQQESDMPTRCADVAPWCFVAEALGCKKGDPQDEDEGEGGSGPLVENGKAEDTLVVDDQEEEEEGEEDNDKEVNEEERSSVATV